jgi:hypothetical protein
MTKFFMLNSAAKFSVILKLKSRPLMNIFKGDHYGSQKSMLCGLYVTQTALDIQLKWVEFHEYFRVCD